MAKHKFKLSQPPIAHEFDRQHPHLKGLWALILETDKETDRGMVLVLSSFLEEVTKRLLLSFMVQGTREKDFFEGGNVPLGTFSSRIKTAHALGLITKDERHDLDVIRDIRNAFAHQVGGDFTELSIADQCRSLKHSAGEEADSRTQFRSSALVLIARLANRGVAVAKERRVELHSSGAPQWQTVSPEEGSRAFAEWRRKTEGHR
jgi:hypothetical protein